MASTTILTLPDLISQCPFTWSTNPHHETAGPEATAWLDEFFQGSALTRLRKARGDLLASYTYPYVDHEFFRLCSDNMNLLFALDGISDDQDAQGAQETRETFLKALKGEPCEDNVVSRLTKDFVNRHAKHFNVIKDRYIQHNEEYIGSVVKEAGYRQEGEILKFKDYRAIRRDTGGVAIAFDLIEISCGFVLPDEVYDDPNFKQVYNAALDMVDFSNDVYSYKAERAQGLDGHNIITILMHHNGFTLQEAMDHAGFMYQGLVKQLLEGKASLQSYGDVVDPQIQLCIKGLEDWVVGNLHWSLDSMRYFGEGVDKEGLKTNRRVVIDDV